MKIIITETQFDTLYQEQKNENGIDKSKYTLTNSNNTLVKVNIDKLLSKFKNDSPDYYIPPDTKVASDIERINSSINFIKNYSIDSRFLNKVTNERYSDMIMEFEAPLIYFHNGKLGIKDGRHRILAMKSLGYNNMYIEVPTEQVELCKDIM